MVTPAAMNYVRQRLLIIKQQTWISEIQGVLVKKIKQQQIKNFQDIQTYP